MLADLASSAMVGTLFILLAAFTALLWMAWRGLIAGRRQVKPAFGRLWPYVQRLEDEARAAQHEVIAPQIEVVAWQSGLKAAWHAFLSPGGRTQGPGTQGPSTQETLDA